MSADQDRCLGVTLSVRDVTLLVMVMMMTILMTSVSLVAGWVGGSTGLVFGHPLDTVKVTHVY